MSAVALIPARSGSKRVPDKNIRNLRGHPLLAYAIRSAIDSGVFEAVICATDSEDYAAIARHYGAQTPFLRPSEISGDKSPDIEWVQWILSELKSRGSHFEAYSILRPTSPFRSVETIQRAAALFFNDHKADSLRAVEKCRQHPGKMWAVKANRMSPLLPFTNEGVPWHSCQYAALPEIYVQNASLEIAWTSVPLERHSIAGDIIIPFISQGLEGFDINDPEDWIMAEHYLDQGAAKLPLIHMSPFKKN